MGVQKVVKQVGGVGKGGSQGTYFERLRAVADLRYDDSADDAAHQVVLDKIGECEDLVRQYARANGFRSQEVRSAIDEWARAFLADPGGDAGPVARRARRGGPGPRGNAPGA